MQCCEQSGCHSSWQFVHNTDPSTQASSCKAFTLFVSIDILLYTLATSPECLKQLTSMALLFAALCFCTSACSLCFRVSTFFSRNSLCLSYSDSTCSSMLAVSRVSLQWVRYSFFTASFRGPGAWMNSTAPCRSLWNRLDMTHRILKWHAITAAPF